MTQAVGKRNWNEEAIARMVRDLVSPWGDLSVNINSILDGNRIEVEKVTEWAIEYLGKINSILAQLKPMLTTI